jgi:prepilin-type N-terminal cleavage/methylation domain-containing protein
MADLLDVLSCKRSGSVDRMARGWTLIELLVVIAVIAILAIMCFPPLGGRRVRAKGIHCVNNLKQVGFAFHVWAADHNDQFPMQLSITNAGTLEFIEAGQPVPHYQLLSNQLSTPSILVCPADKKRKSADNFAGAFSNTNLSYFVGLDATATNPAAFHRATAISLMVGRQPGAF